MKWEWALSLWVPYGFEQRLCNGEATTHKWKPSATTVLPFKTSLKGPNEAVRSEPTLRQGNDKTQAPNEQKRPFTTRLREQDNKLLSTRMEPDLRKAKKEHGGAESATVFALRVHRAEEMLRSFGSIGVTAFDLTCTNIEGEKTVFRKNRPLPTLVAQLPVILQTADSREWNVIVRPHPVPGRVVVQLDDLDRGKLACVEDLAFLTFETSPGSFQAWVAIEGSSESESLIRRFRQGSESRHTRKRGNPDLWKSEYKAEV